MQNSPLAGLAVILTNGGGVCLSERTSWRRLRLGDSRHRYRPRVSTSHGDLNLGGFGLVVEPGTDGVAPLRSVAWSRLA